MFRDALFIFLLLANVTLVIGRRRPFASSQVNRNYTTDIVMSETFGGWKSWKKYPLCNPDVNPNTSPIVINTNDIIPDESTAPIVVHGGTPSRNCLSLSILYKDLDLEMEVVSIVPLPECHQILTHIGGAGEKRTAIREFRRALIFFTNSTQMNPRRAFPPPHSLHHIDGKAFDMEIAIEFADPSDNHSKSASTEVHVMVEAVAFGEIPENPIWKPLENAIPALRKKIIAEATGASHRAKRLKKLESRCLQSRRMFAESLPQFQSLNKSIETMQRRVNDILGMSNRDFRRLKEAKSEAIPNGTLYSKMDWIEDELKELEAKKVYLKRVLSNMDLEHESYWGIKKMLFQVKSKIIMYDWALNTARQGREPDTSNFYEEKLKKAKKLLKKFKVGIPGEDSYPGQLYDSPDALVHRLTELKETRTKVLQYQKEFNKHCEQLRDYQLNVAYATVPIRSPFQISWFFPMTGGFFMYDGSSPIPRCERRQHSIVFENPIQITTEQLESFQSIPSLFALRRNFTNVSIDNYPKVDLMIPVIQDESIDRRVWHISKPPLYLSDDALHRKAETHKHNFTKEGDEISDTFSSGIVITPLIICNPILLLVAILDL